MTHIKDMGLEISLVEKTPYFDLMVKRWQDSETVATLARRAALQDAQAAMDTLGVEVLHPQRFAENVRAQLMRGQSLPPAPIVERTFSLAPEHISSSVEPPDESNFDPYEDFEPSEQTTGPYTALTPEVLDNLPADDTVIMPVLESEPLDVDLPPED